MLSSSPDSKSQLWASIQVGLCTHVAHAPLLQLHVHIHCLHTARRPSARVAKDHKHFQSTKGQAS